MATEREDITLRGGQARKFRDIKESLESEVVKNVEQNRKRSMSNKELLTGDPEVLDRSLVECVRELEGKIDQ